MDESLFRALYDNLHAIAGEAVEEAFKAAKKWPPMNSAHEGFAVLSEEVEELSESAGMKDIIVPLNKLWKNVRVNQKKRDPVAMRAEAIQVAAMAIRFANDIIDGGRIGK